MSEKMPERIWIGRILRPIDSKADPERWGTAIVAMNPIHGSNGYIRIPESIENPVVVKEDDIKQAVDFLEEMRWQTLHLPADNECQCEACVKADMHDQLMDTLRSYLPAGPEAGE